MPPSPSPPPVQAYREYDGGKYAALLTSSAGGGREQPVAAATFNVWGPLAQLCMVATWPAARQRGHAGALLSELEACLGTLGVQEVAVQARGPTMRMWERRGYALATPAQAAELHAAVPLAYYDVPLLLRKLL